MIYVIEPQCKSYEHINNNISILEILPLLFPNESFKFFALKSHVNVLNLMNKQIVVSDIADIGNIENTKTFMRNLLFMANKDNAAKIFFLSISSSQMYYAERLLKPVSFKVYMFMHYVTSELSKRPSFRPHLFIKWLYFTLLFGQSRIKKIVYSESIAANINKYLLNHNAVKFCNHPYDFSDKKLAKVQNNLNTGLHFVFPGEGRIEKGILDFLEIGKNYKNKASISFSVAGSTNLNQVVFQDSGVDCIMSEDLLDDKEYKSRMEKADYFVLLHNPELYKYIYSGVLLDAIKYQKPIIAIRNSVFEEFFYKYGDIGYLLDSMLEVKDLIGYLYCNPDDQYERHLANIYEIYKEYKRDTIETIRAVM
jgi:hypothetical protein